jgi:hypothetical protein
MAEVDFTKGKGSHILRHVEVKDDKKRGMQKNFGVGVSHTPHFDKARPVRHNLWKRT